MSRSSLRIPNRLAVVALAAALAAPAAWAQGTASETEPDHLVRSTEIVGIGRTQLVPTVLVVPHASAFGWLNYASGVATITFDEDISAKLTCRSPGAFRARGPDLASPRVASGSFVTLCSLAPGEYDYRVELDGSEEPLLGKLVVEAEG